MENVNKTIKPAKKMSIWKITFFSLLSGFTAYLVFSLIAKDPDAPLFFGLFTSFWVFLISMLTSNPLSRTKYRLIKKNLSSLDPRNPSYCSNPLNPASPLYINRDRR